MSKRYVMGTEIVECGCGVWKIPDLPCWNETNRKQTTIEAFAEAGQAIRNLGYTIIKSIPLVGGAIGKR